VERVEQFLGIDLAAARQKLPKGKFQIDENGEREEAGTWKPRRGYQHTTVAQAPSAVVSLMGFDLPGDDFALIFAEGGNVHGHRNVGEQ